MMVIEGSILNSVVVPSTHCTGYIRCSLASQHWLSSQQPELFILMLFSGMSVTVSKYIGIRMDADYLSDFLLSIKWLSKSTE